MEHLAKLNAAARLSDLPSLFPPDSVRFTNEYEDGVLYIKVYVVHVSVLKEAVVVRHFFKLVSNLP